MPLTHHQPGSSPLIHVRTNIVIEERRRRRRNRSKVEHAIGESMIPMQGWNQSASPIFQRQGRR